MLCLSKVIELYKSIVNQQNILSTILSLIRSYKKIISLLALDIKAARLWTNDLLEIGKEIAAVKGQLKSLKPPFDFIYLN